MGEETTMSEGDPAAAAREAKGRKAMRWLGNFVLGGALVLIVIVAAAAVLARYDVIGKLAGFAPFYMALNPARALTILGLIFLVIGIVRKTGGVWKLALGTALSAALLGAIYALLVIPGGKVPPIHDITTNIESPPQFAVLNVEPVSTGPFSRQEWRAFHEGAYGDIGAIVIDKAPAQVLADAQALAEARGWEIAAYDAQAGRMEATATAGFVRFLDDVVVQVTPVADGSTRVDMRSVSRVGVSDIGYNAARIRQFLADLQTAAS